jgi:hypothetical protein
VIANPITWGNYLIADTEAGKFGRSKEVKVKVAADVQPVPPASKVPGYPPLVEFTDVRATDPVSATQDHGIAEPVHLDLPVVNQAALTVEGEGQ